MGHFNQNWIDDTILEFPRTGFWIIHVLGAVVFFYMGMRFAAKRAAPFPIMMLRMLRMLGR